MMQRATPTNTTDATQMATMAPVVRPFLGAGGSGVGGAAVGYVRQYALPLTVSAKLRLKSPPLNVESTNVALVYVWPETLVHTYVTVRLKFGCSVGAK